jgi:hypothetical protein
MGTRDNVTIFTLKLCNVWHFTAAILSIKSKHHAMDWLGTALIMGLRIHQQNLEKQNS